MPDQDAAWNSIRRTHAVEVGKINSHGLFRQLNNNTKQEKSGDIHNVLSLAHDRTAHRGRQITSKWISNNYSKVNVKVVEIFAGLCPIHVEQQSVTSRVKLVDKPIQSC